MLRSKIALDVYNAIQMLCEADMAAPAPQNIANSNPMQPLPGQSNPQATAQTQVVGSSGGSPVTSTGEPLTIDTIIDRFNVIRGGKSFSDPDVYSQLTNIFNALPEQEKMSLEKILTNIGEIVTGPEDTQPVVNARQTQGMPQQTQQPTGQQPQSAPASVQAAAPQANIPPVAV